MNRMHMSISVVALLSAAALAQQEQYTVSGERITPQLIERDNGARGVELASPVGTGFTYQGYLEQSDAPADGRFDLRFTLYDDVGLLVAGPICHDNVSVFDGLFTVELNFGSQFSGAARYLEIGVRPGGAVGDCASGSYTVLSPREKITATPYALGLKLPYAGQGDAAGASVVSITNTSSAGASSGVLGINVGPSVFGFIDHAGVRGESSHLYGAGILGISDLYIGVVGYTYGDYNTGTFGRSDGIGGSGVRGWATGSEGIGVLGQSSQLDGWAGYFEGRGYFSGRLGIGTSAPSQMLDVNGYVKTNGYQMTSGAGAGKVLTSDASGFGTWQAVPGTVSHVGYTSGNGNTPSATNQFLSPTITVTITAGQKIFITANRAFGSTSAGGAANLDLYVGYRVSGSGAVPTNFGGGMFNHTCVQNERTNFGINGVITGLAAGTYEVGMTGDDDGNGNWNNNEWGYISVMVIN